LNDPVLWANATGERSSTGIALLEVAGSPRIRLTGVISRFQTGYWVQVIDKDGKVSQREFGEIPTEVELESLGLDLKTARLVSTDKTLVSASSGMPYDISFIDDFDDFYKEARINATSINTVAGGRELITELSTSSKARYLDLGKTWGDTVLVSTSIDSGGGDDTIVVDTGNAGGGFIDRLAKNMGGEGRKRIRLLITHTDADHIRGAKRIITDPMFDVVEIVIGTDGRNFTQISDEVIKILEDDARYRRGGAYGATLYHYIKTTTDASDEAVVVVEQDSEGLNRYIVRGRTAKIDMYQMGNPPKPNDSGLFVQIRETGKSQLLTDDATEKSLSALLNDSNINLESGVLKWPHHIWFPKDDLKALAVLEKLLKRTNPHTVIMTNKAGGQPDENAAYIEDFIYEKLGKHVRVLHTTSDGNIDVSILDEHHLETTITLRKAA